MADEKRSWTQEEWQEWWDSWNQHWQPQLDDYNQEPKEENAGDGDAGGPGLVEPPAKRKKVSLPTGPLAKASTKAAGATGAETAGATGGNAGGQASGSRGDTSHPAGFPAAW